MKSLEKLDQDHAGIMFGERTETRASCSELNSGEGEDGRNLEMKCNEMK